MSQASTPSTVCAAQCWSRWDATSATGWRLKVGGFFIEGFEVGFRFETAEGEVIEVTFDDLDDCLRLVT